MAKLNDYFEVTYSKTFTREEEKDGDSGYETTVNNVFDEGIKTFETIDDIKEWIDYLKEYQDKDEDKDEYSYVDYSYIDDADCHPEICGIVVNNRKESVKYEEIKEEIEIFESYMVLHIDDETAEKLSHEIYDIIGDDLSNIEKYKEYIIDYEDMEQFLRETCEYISDIRLVYRNNTGSGEYEIQLSGEKEETKETELGIMEIETIWININKIHSEDISEEDLKNIIE